MGTNVAAVVAAGTAARMIRWQRCRCGSVVEERSLVSFKKKKKKVLGIDAAGSLQGQFAARLALRQRIGVAGLFSFVLDERYAVDATAGLHRGQRVASAAANYG